MTGYQKLKTETKYLWWYINEVLTRVYKTEYPNNQLKASEEAEKQIAWLKLQIHKAQNEKK